MTYRRIHVAGYALRIPRAWTCFSFQGRTYRCEGGR